jgi:DNA-binding CsgD family transcriptional regulator
VVLAAEADLAILFWLGPTMMDLLKVANQRSLPGILILDHRKKPIFFNPVALAVLGGIDGAKASTLKNAFSIILPREISALYDTLKKDHNYLACQTILIPVQETTYCCRGVFLQGPSGSTGKTFFIFFLIEKIMQRQMVDLETVKKQFNLSERQMEIVECLLAGLSNKEMADESCVSEDTIKGHLRHIMKRLDVHSRTGILSKIFQLFNEASLPPLNSKRRPPPKNLRSVTS